MVSDMLKHIFIDGAAIILILGPILTVFLLIYDRERFYQPKRKTDRAVALGFVLNLWLAYVGLWILGVV